MKRKKIPAGAYSGKMKQKQLLPIVVLLALVVAYALYSFSGNHLTGGSQSWGECIDADKDVENGVPTAYCYDAESYKVDRCIDSKTLLDWYCHQGWCKNKHVDCAEKYGNSCQFGECTN